ncbi:MAG: PAS domain S-box protein [Deltaproteobacteria bacterium]|nr:PAS domain S-box protein [Deltaproteobacteria bacterium]
MMAKLPEIFKKYNWVFFGVLILTGIYLTSLYNFLLFHSLAELFSIVIAFGIFIVAWHSRRFLDNNYLLFLGIAYLFVGAIDAVHTLAYKGMGVFQEYEANLPTQLWIVARYVESLSLFIAPFFFKRKLRVGAVFWAYTVAIALLFGTIFYGPIFPECFIEGKGLTPFKKISEYVISLILLGSMALLIRKRSEFDRYVLICVVWSIIATIISELAFTFYISVYGLSNLVGHLFKIISFYLIYKAIIETGLTKPYSLLWRNLKLSEEKLREERNRAQGYLDVAGVMLLVIGSDQKVRLINKKGGEVLGYDEKEIVGKNWFDHFMPERVRENAKAVFSKIISGEKGSFEYVESVILTKRGEARIIAWYSTILRDEAENVVATLSSGEDITERKRAEEEREKIVRELKEALGKVKLLSGFIPICASCKKIRDDKGYWEQVEVYIRDHSEAEFSHGICPECMKKLYPEISTKNPKLKEE